MDFDGRVDGDGEGRSAGGEAGCDLLGVVGLGYEHGEVGVCVGGGVRGAVWGFQDEGLGSVWIGRGR